MSVGLPHSHIRFPPSPLSSGCRRDISPPYCLSLPKSPRTALTEGSIFGAGLRTPPVEDMSTAYQQAPMAPAYDGHSAHYANKLAHASRSRVPAVSETTQNGYPKYAQPQPLESNNYENRSQPIPSQHQTLAPVKQPLRSSSPKAAPKSTKKQVQRDADTLIYHNLEIPKCISANGGNLAEFAAQMTCLFWFETTDDLKQAESIRTRPVSAPIPRLPPGGRPGGQFRSWVHNVLSTTQVTQNVILLALLLVYRLRMSTPSIKGREGSEFRMLTVALMLGNKFLDDNTYTNKTWAEVSSFAVTEIHVMEVEFLSNMRYNLLASADEWDAWLVKLSCFHEYYQRALRLPPSPLLIPHQATQAGVTPLGSPTTAAQVDSSDLLSSTNYSPSSSQSQAWAFSSSAMVSPLASKPSLAHPTPRKRPSDMDALEPPAKRAVPSRLPQQVHQQEHHSGTSEPARLPAPHLTVATNNNLSAAQQQQQVASMYHTPTGMYQAPPPAAVQAAAAPTSQPQVSLPPLQTGMRAMASVYQPTPPTSIVQQHAPAPIPSSAAPPAAQAVIPSSGFPNPVALPSQRHFGTPSKRRSPGSLAPFASSPSNEPFGPPQGVHTPLVHTPLSSSPSFYLQHRNSPYKPIRHVNTLLCPPSASLEQYHLAMPLQPTQMHYQPLGRRHDLRTGVVPDYVLYNRAQGQQMAGVTSQPQVHQLAQTQNASSHFSS